MYTLTGYLSICCYRPPMKLREGNVFSRVCLSAILFTVGGGLHMMHWISPPIPAPPDMGPYCEGAPGPGPDSLDMGPRCTGSS